MSSNNNYDRLRDKTLAFRVSESEKKEIDDAIRMSGLLKQDYFFKKLTNKEIIVTPNPRMFKALKEIMEEILVELKRISDNPDIPPIILTDLKYIVSMMSMIGGDTNG